MLSAALAALVLHAPVPPAPASLEESPGWIAAPADGVGMRLSPAAGRAGGALRLDFDFSRGAGYAIARLPLDLDLPENFEVSFDLRADGLPNDLELKLLGPDGGDTVWWHNRRRHRFTGEWEHLRSRRRHFEFAWGPMGPDRPLGRISGLEIVVTAAEGGVGHALIDNLTIRELPPDRPYDGTPLLRAEGGSLAGGPELGPDGRLAWTVGAAGGSLVVDFGRPREFSALVLEWEGSLRYDALADGDRPLGRGRGGGPNHFFAPETLAERLTIAVEPGAGATLRGVRVLPVGAVPDRNAFLERVADDFPRGLHPRNWLREKPFWTIVGVPEDRNEALFGEDGSLELFKGGPTLEPFVLANGRLLTWAEGRLEQSLRDGYLPIPTARRSGVPVELEVTAVAAGEAGASSVHLRYRLMNASAERQEGALALALRPFQILPQWHRLNITGGAAFVPRVEASAAGLAGDGWRVEARSAPGAAIAGTLGGGDPVLALAAGSLPYGALTRASASASIASSPHDGDACGLLAFGFDLEPGASASFYVDVPLHAGSGSAAPGADPAAAFERVLAAASERWRALLNRVELSGPAPAQRVFDTVRSQIAYILVNADGPGIQPGSRTYERSWIRDGALTGTALLYTGHPEPVRRFIDWYAPHQYPSGKVPCVVDRRGPDPVDEHDSTGQLIYLINRYHDFTGDSAVLAEYYPAVLRGVEYLQSLRARRMTPEFADPDAPAHAFYGLVTESISHEGYSAKPMHSYWDNFFVLRGFRDAAAIAGKLGRGEDARRLGALEREFRTNLYDSVRLAMRQQGIDYVPGCVELGDFDATSTSIGVYPVAEHGRIPEPALTNTFERYWRHFVARRDGAAEWRDYTPYEVRNIGTMVRLGEPERAAEMLAWFLEERTPPGWNQWPEVGHSDPRSPGFVGDLPHTWVGSDFVSAVRSMLVYERETDGALVVAAGMPEDWIGGEGTRVRGLPTLHGPIGLDIRRDGDRIVVRLGGEAAPPGGIEIRCPGSAPVAAATVDGRPIELQDRHVRVSAAPAEIVFHPAGPGEPR